MHLQGIKHLYPEGSVVTSKGTDLIDFFEIDEITVEEIPLRQCTEKELTDKHNIRKMYIAGCFYNINAYSEDGDDIDDC